MKLHDVKMPLSGYRLQARSANTEEAESAENQAIHQGHGRTPFGTLMAGRDGGPDIDARSFWKAGAKSR
jgi:hypothetical protein